jgi:uncharacterized membrane protein
MLATATMGVSIKWWFLLCLFFLLPTMAFGVPSARERQIQLAYQAIMYTIGPSTMTSVLHRFVQFATIVDGKASCVAFLDSCCAIHNGILVQNAVLREKLKQAHEIGRIAYEQSHPIEAHQSWVRYMTFDYLIGNIYLARRLWNKFRGVFPGRQVDGRTLAEFWTWCTEMIRHHVPASEAYNSHVGFKALDKFLFPKEKASNALIVLPPGCHRELGPLVPQVPPRRPRKSRPQAVSPPDSTSTVGTESNDAAAEVVAAPGSTTSPVLAQIDAPMELEPTDQEPTGWRIFSWLSSSTKVHRWHRLCTETDKSPNSLTHFFLARQNVVVPSAGLASPSVNLEDFYSGTLRRFASQKEGVKITDSKPAVVSWIRKRGLEAEFISWQKAREADEPPMKKAKR